MADSIQMPDEVLRLRIMMRTVEYKNVSDEVDVYSFRDDYKNVTQGRKGKAIKKLNDEGHLEYTTGSRYYSLPDNHDGLGCFHDALTAPMLDCMVKSECSDVFDTIQDTFYHIDKINRALEGLVETLSTITTLNSKITNEFKAEQLLNNEKISEHKGDIIYMRFILAGLMKKYMEDAEQHLK